MNYPPEDAKIALDIVATLPSVVLRVAGHLRGDGQKIIFINDDIAEWGYNRDDFLSGCLTWLDIVHPKDRASFARQTQDQLARGGDSFSLRYRVVTKPGASLWVTAACTAARKADGEALYTDCVITTDAPAAQDEEVPGEGLRRQQVLGNILQAMHQRSVREAFRAILGQTVQYLGVTRGTLYQNLPGQGKSRITFGWQQGEECPPQELCQEENGALFDALDHGTTYVAYKTDHGALAAVALPVPCGAQSYGFVLFEDCATHRRWPAETLLFLHNVAGLLGTVLQRQHIEEEARRAAWQDQLTGLNNRYSFDRYLKKAMSAAQESGQCGYVLFVDMDDFKIINGGYGHEYGDALLSGVAGYLKRHYADKCRLFRFGGDEFVLLIGQENAKHASAIMDDLLNRARHPWTVLNNEFYCTVSLGVARFPEPGLGVADVIKNAEIAIRSAKSLGKNNCVVFNRGMDNDSLWRVQLERRMRDCIENDFEGFEVYYQPLVSTSGAIVGAEALLRWFDEDGNLTTPAEFIPLAEYLGLIVPLGNYVLRCAAQECWRINRTNPDFSISVNVSIRQFQQHDFLTQTEVILAETSVDRTNMVLEVTEGMPVEDIEQMQLTLEQLRHMGLRIAMDDFGTGYSSLSNMWQLPLDIIKIDRSFVVDVTHDAYSQSFIRLITNLSHSMGRTVCVEGVETAARYSCCAECRVDSIQGYYFYKPMPREALHLAMAQNQTFNGR